MAKANNEKSKLQPRPPVVVVLGHVDHGKTSILDFIRKTKVAEKESGGITQHIGAYQIEHQGKKITFIDTPGHEAFSAMRSRGAKVADLAVLVVAADEGMKPQTKEVISLVAHQNMPFVVALNKADKQGIVFEKVKKQLADNGVLAESSGGKIPMIPTSAKTGKGIDELLEMILLLAEMEELKIDTSAEASGVIIESLLDSKRGITATLLVRQGILFLKDAVAAESTYGLIKTMEDFAGRAIEKAEPSTPVRVTGFLDVPPVGEEWQFMHSLDEARARASQKGEIEKKKREPAQILDIAPEQKVFNLILKGDVFGSLEALRQTLETIPQQEVMIRVIMAEVGQIGEADVKLADSAKAKIFGFRVGPTQIASNVAQRRGVRIFSFDVIYELVKAAREQMALMLEPEIMRQEVGQVKILASFKRDGSRQIIGGRVIKGKAERGVFAEVSRGEEKLGRGRVAQLQANKLDVDACQKDKECGMLFEGEPVVEKGDILVLFREEKKRREL
ncbi:MAG: translation initiation factor IF-2 [Candidatus Portnoybacteria bacterium RBG_19FT_COMBO_36_7]|uniref:Translation initiation factor IF-2 n=1 Tax=Candidatus Portnoybacteria bacterium RBG_19FT_COMBO_36_7 TaxID=1801992 RepID=A0A1G2F7I7_9BACT|nr:MAG: translation initiation factor IF-2 [Candidatus Portnoybacteria bacterium RBG_19FT_COMBO_36_7]